MSAYITLATPMVDQECLLAALADLGFRTEHVEVHQTTVPLVGFEGASRQQRAHVVIRRHHVGAASNDLGFERTTTGFRVHVSDYDRRRYGASWLRQLRARYQHHEANKQEQLAQAQEAADLEARRQAELEARRLEEERQQLVAAQRQAIRDKAHQLGYRVEETMQGDKLRLVLVKRVYS